MNTIINSLVCVLILWFHTIHGLSVSPEKVGGPHKLPNIQISFMIVCVYQAMNKYHKLWGGGGRLYYTTCTKVIYAPWYYCVGIWIMNIKLCQRKSGRISTGKAANISKTITYATSCRTKINIAASGLFIVSADRKMPVKLIIIMHDLYLQHL